MRHPDDCICDNCDERNMTTEAEGLRAQADAAERRSADSFERCDTDGFLTQWAGQVNASRLRLEADIVEAGGTATFAVLCDLAGRWVPSKLIQGRYGPCWALLTDPEDPDEEPRMIGEFVGAFPARESTLTRKGYRERWGRYPARAVLRGSNATNVAAVSEIRPDYVGRRPIEIED